jgi:hypothetical protein
LRTSATHLPERRIDAVIGNVPFADIRLVYGGQRLALHDFFLAKSLDALTTGGILDLVTSHYTLDKQNTDLREYLAEQANFLGAARLPSIASLYNAPLPRSIAELGVDHLLGYVRDRCCWRILISSFVGEHASHVPPKALMRGPP